MKSIILPNYKAEILIVDDTPYNLRLLLNILRVNGYKVRPVTNGTSALEAVEASPPDLILLDILMPEIDGYTICKRLKDNPKTSEIPVIFISALSEGLDKAKAFKVGGADYITKPFQVEEVLARVANQLTLRSLQTQLQQKNQQLTDQNAQLQQQIQERKRADMEIRLLLAATQAISRAEDFHSALDIILSLICKAIQWDYGEAWIESEDGKVLKCVQSQKINDSSLSEFKQASWQLTFAPGIDLPGRIWVSKQPEWIEDVSSAPCQGFLRSKIAKTVGLKAAFGVPILMNEKVLAILIFYQKTVSISQHRLLELIDAVATQISSIIQRKITEEALKFQQNQTERLLLNILPEPIAVRLQQGQNPIADYCEDVSVLFADLVGFTEFSARKTPAAVVEVLNIIFSKFDQLAEQHGLEKIKTIGDAYMVVGGLPTPRPDHAEAIAQMALDMQEALTRLNTETGEDFRLRIGINIGPVVAGVIGTSKFIYDLWGDTVNIASRMESLGMPGQIQVTTATYERLKEQFCFEERGAIAVKGKGNLLTYWLTSKRSNKIALESHLTVGSTDSIRAETVYYAPGT